VLLTIRQYFAWVGLVRVRTDAGKGLEKGNSLYALTEPNPAKKKKEGLGNKRNIWGAPGGKEFCRKKGKREREETSYSLTPKRSKY